MARITRRLFIKGSVAATAFVTAMPKLPVAIKSPMEITRGFSIRLYEDGEIPGISSVIRADQIMDLSFDEDVFSLMSNDGHIVVLDDLPQSLFEEAIDRTAAAGLQELNLTGEGLETLQASSNILRVMTSKEEVGVSDASAIPEAPALPARSTLFSGVRKVLSAGSRGGKQAREAVPPTPEKPPEPC